jgi:hypothetical protein
MSDEINYPFLPSVKPTRLSLKFLAAYSVAIVNSAALQYIAVRVLVSGIRRLTG